MRICHGHTFAEQPFVERKDSWLIQMQAGVNEIIGWGQMIFTVTSVYQREILQMCVIVENEVVEYD